MTAATPTQTTIPAGLPAIFRALGARQVSDDTLRILLAALDEVADVGPESLGFELVMLDATDRLLPVPEGWIHESESSENPALTLMTGYKAGVIACWLTMTALHGGVR